MGSPRRLKIAVLLTGLLVIGVGIVVWQPRWIIALLAKRSPEVIYFVETREPAAALTIDDGPDPATTGPILDLLKRYQARATFFLISGHIPGNEAVVRRMVAQGHELGNHLTTDEPSILLKGPEFEKRLLEAHTVLSRFAEVRWFRPGSGWYNREMLARLRKHGYRCALGSVYPFDPQIPSAWFSRRHVLARAHPGSIILLHDRGDRGNRTIEVLSAILPELKRRGLRLITLSELWRGSDAREEPEV